MPYEDVRARAKELAEAEWRGERPQLLAETGEAKQSLGVLQNVPSKARRRPKKANTEPFGPTPGCYA